MNTIVTTRLPTESIHELELISKLEYVDRASLLRKMILEQIQEYLLYNAAQSYQQGELTMEEAARKAKVSIWKMMDYITAKNITPPAQDLAEMKQHWEHAKKIFRI